MVQAMINGRTGTRTRVGDMNVVSLQQETISFGGGKKNPDTREQMPNVPRVHASHGEGER